MQKLFKNNNIKNYSIIKNSYQKINKHKISRYKKLKVLISSWSDNWIKGFEIYQYIDSLLDEFDTFEVDFIGRKPLEFRNINYLGVMSNENLKKNYIKYDIYLTASLLDPCSNSLAEAKSNNCMIIARNNGGHPELIGKYDLLFKNHNDLYDIFQNLETYYKTKRICRISQEGHKTIKREERCLT